MRTWGRVYDELGNATWVQVNPDPNGYLDSIMLTTLVQCLKLNLGESPFYSNLGIPAQQTVMTQIYPDYYVNNIQQWFAPNFASLLVARQPTFEPTYLVTAVTQQGSTITVPVAV